MYNTNRMKLDFVMFVDDSRIDNIIHRRIVNRAGFAKKVATFEEPGLALTFLQNTLREEAQFPDLIFLDLDMPLMNGFVFLDQYAGMVGDIPKQSKVVILTSSDENNEMKRAHQHSQVQAFVRKPLDKKSLIRLMYQLAWSAPPVIQPAQQN